MTLTYLHTSQGATVAAASALTGRQGQEGLRQWTVGVYLASMHHNVLM